MNRNQLSKMSKDVLINMLLEQQKGTDREHRQANWDRKHCQANQIIVGTSCKSVRTINYAAS